MKTNISTYISILVALFSCTNATYCMNKKESIHDLVSNDKLLNSLNEKALLQFKRRVKNYIMHAVVLEKVVTYPSHDTKISLRFWDKETLIGSATCYKKKDRQKIKLRILSITRCYQNYGIGTFFFNNIQNEIHTDFPEIPIMHWNAYPYLFKPKNPLTEIEEFEEAKENLYDFYEKKCKATVNRTTGKCFINLKETDISKTIEENKLNKTELTHFIAE